MPRLRDGIRRRVTCTFQIKYMHDAVWMELPNRAIFMYSTHENPAQMWKVDATSVSMRVQNRRPQGTDEMHQPEGVSSHWNAFSASMVANWRRYPGAKSPFLNFLCNKLSSYWNLIWPLPSGISVTDIPASISVLPNTGTKEKPSVEKER